MAKEKRYPCMGHEITIKEAADITCVSVAAIRQQLSKMGGSMENVMLAYDKKYGGVFARMEQMVKRDKEQDAVDEILDALGMSEDCEEPNEDDLPDALDMVVPLAENAGVMVIPDEAETEPAAEPEPEGQEPRGNTVLCALNLAIKAIYALDKCMLGNSILYDVLQNCAADLKEIRNDKFGHLVDWEAIARGRNF